jgi:hypothetical protein
LTSTFIPLVPHASQGRHVDPDVHPLNQFLRQRDVVIFQEHHPAAISRVLRESDPFLDHLLPAVVDRMRLAGDHKLGRTGFVAKQACQAGAIGQ